MIRLNLLPPEIKEEIEYSRKNAKIYQNLLKLVTAFLVTMILMGVVWYVVWNNLNIASYTDQSSYEQYQSLQPIETSAIDFYNRLNLIEKLRNDRIDWPLIFAEITRSTPANVRLISFDFTNAATNRVALVGFALSNSDVGNFRELLSKSKLFQFVDIESVTIGNDPLDSARKGVTFRISLNMNMKEAKK